MEFKILNKDGYRKLDADEKSEYLKAKRQWRKDKRDDVEAKIQAAIPEGYKLVRRDLESRFGPGIIVVKLGGHEYCDSERIEIQI